MSTSETAASPLVFVVVLQNQPSNDTVECLASLNESTYRNCKILLLDYASDKSSLAAYKSIPHDFQAVRLMENKGYAGNNNTGIQIALDQGADWILILNNDTVLDPSCISSLIAVGESDPTIGILGPMVYHFDEPNIIQSAGGTLGKYWQDIHIGMDHRDDGQFKSSRPVDWISGCAILIRREVVEQVGALDPDYFLYWEEIEWCIRAGKKGWKIVHVPQARLWHKGVKRDYQPRPYVTYYMTRNYLHTLSKHHAPVVIRLLAFLRIFHTLLSWSMKPRWKDKRDHRDAMWKGVVDFFHRRVGPMPS